jgi:undecaprenyl-diphosphatase
MDTLLQLDYQLFEWINSGLSNDLFDLIMPLWRSKFTWIPFYLVLAVFLIYRYRVKGFYLILAAVLTIGISDTMSSKVIKKSVKRLRPCKTEIVQDHTNMLINCGSGFSFTSSHATNHFALAFFLILTLGRRFRNLKLPLAVWAASIAFGQVYVGAHFPLDVIGGGLLGILIAWVVAKAYFQFKSLPIGELSTS